MAVLRLALLLSLPLLAGVACGDSSARDVAPSVTPPRVTAPPAPVPAPPDRADPAPPPPAPSTRREGNLVVEWPPTHAPLRGGRMRAHVTGSLSANATRYWAGPTQVPDWLPLHRSALELFLLDETPEGFFALYREPYGATPNGCALGGPRADNNCEFVVALFGRDRTERWAQRLNDFFSRPDHLEVQDVRYAGEVVYFNEACQSYSREARGRCSSLVALDATTRQLRFRTRPLVSNGEILVLDAYVLASYGFTAEPDSLSLVSRATGRVAARMELPVAAQHLALVSTSPTRAVVDVSLAQRAVPWRISLEALDQPAPHFVPETPPPAEQPSRFPTLRMGMHDPVRPPPR